jgi:hypothetical protein
MSWYKSQSIQFIVVHFSVLVVFLEHSSFFIVTTDEGNNDGAVLRHGGVVFMVERRMFAALQHPSQCRK